MGNRMKKLWALLLAASMLLGICPAVLAVPGDQSDPITTFTQLKAAIIDAGAMGTAQEPKEIYISGMLEQTEKLYLVNDQHVKLIGVDSESGLKRATTYSGGGDMIDVGNSDENNVCSLTLEKIIMDGGAVWSRSGDASSTNNGVPPINSSLLSVRKSATLNLNSGTVLRNNQKNGSGAAVWLVGTLNINGATIKDNATTNGKTGGAINVRNDYSKLTMNSGEISGNYASGDGGGVYIQEGGTFIMKGGKIINNRTADGKSGGAVDLIKGLFQMEAGEISGNSSGNSGGAIYVGNNDNSHIVRLLGGSISNNTARATNGGTGGAAWVPGKGTAEKLELGGGIQISGNKVGTSSTIDNNLYLDGNGGAPLPIRLLSPLTGGAIGVTLQNYSDAHTLAVKAAGFTGSFTDAASWFSLEDGAAYTLERVGDEVWLAGNSLGCTHSGEGAFAKGEGTAQSPFRVENAAQLRHVEEHNGAYICLVSDIDMSQVGEWTPLFASTPFTGDFNGKGFSINGLSINAEAYAGLFANIADTGKVYNLSVAGQMTVGDGTLAAGSIAAQSSGVLSNVTSSMNILITASAPAGAKVGGILGENTAKVENTSFSGTITDQRSNSGSYVGAIVGNANITPPAGLPTMITAHAGFDALGGSGDTSEDNTIDNIIKSINHGPDAIEVDVLMDSNGVLRLTHNAPATDAHPTLEEAFQLLMGTHPRSNELNENGATVRIQSDSKTNGIIDDVLALAQRVNFPLNRLILAGDNSYDHVMENIDAIRAAVNQGMDFWMNPKYILSDEAMANNMDGFLAKIKALNLPEFTVNSYYGSITNGILARFKQEGINVSVWTLNSTDAIQSQITRGMYNTTSRLLEILETRNALLTGVSGSTFDEKAGWPEIGQLLQEQPVEKKPQSIRIVPTYDVGVRCIGPGSSNVKQTREIDAGSIFRVKLYPEAGYELLSFTVNGEAVDPALLKAEGNALVYGINRINQDYVFVAEFGEHFVVEVPEVEITDVPKTGDVSTPWGFAMLAAALILGFAYWRRRTHNAG